MPQIPPRRIGDIQRQCPLSRRRIADIAIGQVLDQRINRGGCGRRIETDRQGRPRPARQRPDHHTAIAHIRARQTNLPGPGALVADRGAVFGQEAGQGQAAAVEVIFAVGEHHIRVEQLRRRVHRVFDKGDRGGKAGQHRRVVLRGDSDHDGLAPRGGIFKTDQGASILTHDQIKIAIAIQIDEIRGGEKAYINPIERIGRTRLRGEHSGRIGPDHERAVQFTRHQIKIAIAIQIAETRSDAQTPIDPTHRTGFARQRRKAGGHMLPQISPRRVGDVQHQRPVGGRCIADIAIGQVLDQRVDGF